MKIYASAPNIELSDLPAQLANWLPNVEIYYPDTEDMSVISLQKNLQAIIISDIMIVDTSEYTYSAFSAFETAYADFAGVRIITVGSHPEMGYFSLFRHCNTLKELKEVLLG